jgi:hypothetical protein
MAPVRAYCDECDLDAEQMQRSMDLLQGVIGSTIELHAEIFSGVYAVIPPAGDGGERNERGAR